MSIYWFYLPQNHVDTQLSNLLLTPLYIHKLQFISDKLFCHAAHMVIFAN